MSAKCLSTKPIAQWLAASLLINFVANDASWWPASSLPASLIIGTFHEIQKLLSKTNGKVIADVMTPAPLVVRETTNLEDAARLLLVTKYRRLPVVDSSGKLVGIITRGNVVQAALEIKKKVEGTL